METPTNRSVVSASEDRYSEIANKVFHLELLREKILGYLIFETGPDPCVNIQSCRLVNKSWLRSTSRVLRKSQKPMFYFGLYNRSPGDLEENEERLSQFLRSITEGVRLEERVPTHSITTTGDFLRPEKSQSLRNLFDCFPSCGSGLVDLYLQIPAKFQHSTLQNTNISFPKLRNFVLYIKKADLDTSNNLDDKIGFVQKALGSCKQLRSFELTIFSSTKKVPDSLGKLVLPASIKDLTFGCKLTECSIQVLVENSLPNLDRLELSVTGLPFKKDGILTNVLQNVGKNLKYLHFRDAFPMEISRHSTTFKLPFMEKLEFFRLDNPFLELQGYPSSLEKLVPALNEMMLCNQTIPRFRKWVDESCFHSVTSLRVSLLNENEYRRDLILEDADYGTFDLPSMRALKKGFPNIQKLDITFLGFELSNGAFSVLWEMKTLSSLAIFIGSTRELEMSAILDAALIGIEVEDVPRLKNSSALWEDLQARNAPSIRDLTDLTTLNLTIFGARVDGQHISDVTFDFAFFKMPKLTSLALNGGFYATKEFEEKWIKLGRTFITDFEHEDFSDASSDDGNTEDEEDTGDEEESEEGVDIWRAMATRDEEDSEEGMDFGDEEDSEDDEIIEDNDIV